VGFNQYNEPVNELPPQSVPLRGLSSPSARRRRPLTGTNSASPSKPNAEARAIMASSQEEEFKHFGMDLEFLLRQNAKWRSVLQAILFTDGDIVGRGKLESRLRNDSDRRVPA